MPNLIKGHFGNNIKREIIYQNTVNNVPQKKIKQELEDKGIKISGGQINKIIINESEQISQEYEDIRTAGITSAKELRVDDTGSRHNGKNGACLVIQNDHFTHFTSSNSKSRMQFLKVLRGKNTNYVINSFSLDYINQYNPTESQKGCFKKLENINFQDRETFKQALDNVGISPLTCGKNLLLHVEEAGILGYAFNTGLPKNVIILSDGAQQYKILTHAACWIHAERSIKRLIPVDETDANEIKKICDEIWIYYELLKNYKKNPENDQKIILCKQFDKIFSQTVTSIQLAAALKKFRTNKDDLLRVLDYPFIDLHNNSSEQAIRPMVIKKKVSGQTRSDAGRNARDVFISVIKTCRKHGISAFEYLDDRISETKKIPYLPDLIIQKSKLFQSAPT